MNNMVVFETTMAIAEAAGVDGGLLFETMSPLSKSAHRTWQHTLQNSVAADEVMIERRADMGQNQ
jgi:hypothetical protein